MSKRNEKVKGHSPSVPTGYPGRKVQTMGGLTNNAMQKEDRRFFAIMLSEPLFREIAPCLAPDLELLFFRSVKKA